MKKNYIRIAIASLLLAGTSISSETKAQCVAPAAPTAPDVTATCGGSATLMASGSSGNYQWYDMQSGGTLLGSNATYVSPPITAATTYYVQATNTTAQTMMPLPAQGSTFTGNVRGYYFTAPVDFTITGLKIPADNAGLQNIAVVRFTAGAPPLFATTTNSFNTLYLTQNNPSTSILTVNIPVATGDIIGILGSAGTVNSYAAAPTNSTIGGMSVTLARLGMQLPLNANPPQALWTEAAGNISRVEMYYTQTCASPMTTVNATITPIPVMASSGSSAVCLGTGTTVSASGATSYNWMPGNISGATISVTPLTPTTYTVTGSDLSGCSNTSTVTVGVNSLPVVSAGASMNTICMGSMETLNGAGALSYTWDNGVMDNVPFAATTTTTYNVTGTDGNGCVNTASTTVTVNTLPTVTASSSAATVCAGDMETLMGGGATSYTWDNGVTDNVAFAAMTTTTYNVTGTDANGCMNTASTMVTVNQLPSVTANASAMAVCMGDMETLTGGGAASYTWDNSVMDGVAFMPAGTMTYNVMGTDGNGCMGIASVMVTVNSLPTVTANASAMTVCMGDMETLTGGGAASYTWDNSVMDGVAFMPAGTMTYNVMGTDGNGCMGMASVMVTVNSLPTVTANASAMAVCMGDMETLTGGGATSYTWDNSVMDGVAFMPASTMTYNVTGTDGNGCMNMASVMVAVNSNPTVTYVEATSYACNTWGAFALSAGNPASGVYSGMGVMGNMYDPTMVVPMNTYMVTYTYTDGNGCMGMDSSAVYVDICSGINTIGGLSSLMVYPNPSTGIYYITLDKLTRVTIYNALGELVFDNEMNAGNSEINMNDFANGMYSLKAVQGNNQQTIHLIKN